MSQISKADIDRLGEKIRSEKDSILEETLNNLQGYRTSHKSALSHTFNMLCANSKKIHTSAIVTYRIKRFESIIGKLQRYPEMRFSRMWDIGGCRCILRNDVEVYKLKKLIEFEKDFEIIKEYDYIINPQTDGYKSLHLFVKHKQNDKIIEVQLRNQTDHNWATLVEITDVIFDSKLKEFGNNKELLRFHYLLSKKNELELNDKKEIALTLKKYNYFDKLSEVFTRNYVKVRRQWFNIESKNNHKYFLIETNKNQAPKIQSFKSANEAEDQYFNLYKTIQNANIVLTHLQTPSYSQISIAYSNYMLTFHSFLDESIEILESLVAESLKNAKIFEFIKFYNLYHSVVYNHIANMMTELREIESYSAGKSNKNFNSNKKEREWVNDIQKRVTKLNQRGKNTQNIFNTNSPEQGSFMDYTIRICSRVIASKYRRKFRKNHKKGFD